MADDPRDYLKPKHPTSPGMTAVRPSQVRSGAHGVFVDPMHKPNDDTPVNTPIPISMAKIGERTKNTSTTVDDIRGRMVTLETGHADTRVRLEGLATQVVSLDTKVDVLVEESRESRRERLERERAAEVRATAELAFRRERTLKIIGILVPLIAALGTLIAGLAGAFR